MNVGVSDLATNYNVPKMPFFGCGGHHLYKGCETPFLAFLGKLISGCAGTLDVTKAIKLVSFDRFVAN